MSDDDAPSATPRLRTPTGVTTKWQPLILPAVLLVVALPVLPKFDNGFVYDDIPMIVESDFIHDPANIPSAFLHHTMIAADDDTNRSVDTYRPVTLLTFFWDAQISGRDPFSYHLTNLLLHLLCVALLYFLAHRLFGSQTFAAFSAAFFGLSPWLVEAHVWINGRSDPTCTAFGLGALLLFSHALGWRGRRRIGGLVVAALLFFAGLLSKEVLVMLLPAFVMMVGLEGRTPTLKDRAIATSGFFAAAAFYVGVRGAVLSGVRALSDDQQLFLAASRLPVLLIDGLSNLLIPSLPYLRSMAEDYGRVTTPWLIAALAVVLSSTWLVFRFRRRAPLVAFGLLIFAPTLAPAAVIATMSWGGFGRYLYLPAVGVAIALAATVRALFEANSSTERQRRLVSVGLAGYLAVFAAVVAMSVGTFRDQETLCYTSIAAAPDNALANGLLATQREREGRYQEAQTLYERAVALDPGRPKYVHGLAGVLLAQGDVAGARRLAEQALARIGAGGGGDFHAVVVGATFADDPAVAVAHLSQCLEGQPAHPGCRRWAGVLQTRPELAPRYAPLLADAAQGSPALERALEESLASAVNRR